MVVSVAFAGRTRAAHTQIATNATPSVLFPINLAAPDAGDPAPPNDVDRDDLSREISSIKVTPSVLGGGGVESSRRASAAPSGPVGAPDFRRHSQSSLLALGG